MPHARRPLPLVAPLFVLGLFAVAPALAADAGAPQAARALMEAAHWKRARQVLETQEKATPDDPAILSALAEVRAQFGEIEEAEKLARRAVALAPDDAQAHESLAEVVGRRAQKSGPLKGLGLAREFKREAERAVALDPKQVEARDVLMQFHLQAPGIVGADRKKARAYADEIARLDPVRGELALAEYSAATKDTQAIEGCYRRAIAKDPHAVDPHLSLANWLLTPWRLRLDEAEVETRAVLAESPDRAGAWSLLAIIAVKRQDTGALDSILAAADARCPDSRAPWYQAGRLLLLDGRDLPRAEKCFRHYLEIDPEPGSPTLAHGHWRLAQVLEKEGRRPEARAELETALRMKPDLDEAKKDLKRLKG